MTGHLRVLRAVFAVAASAALVVSALSPADASETEATTGTVTGVLMELEVHADARLQLCTETGQCVSTEAVPREFAGGSDFSFTGVAPGEYVIGITGGRFDEFMDDWWPGVESVDDAARVLVEAGETAHVEWNLRRGATLTGWLSNGAEGIVTLSDSRGRELKTSDTRLHISREIYSFTGVRPGTYKLTAQATGFSPGQATVEIAGASTVERDIEMTALGRIVAKVTASPYSSLRGALRLFDLDGEEVRASPDLLYHQHPRTGAVTGTFYVSDVEPGDYRLLFDLTSGGFPTWYGGTHTSRDASIVRVVSGEGADVTQPALEQGVVPTGAISTTVLGPDGERVDGAWVEVYDTDGRKRRDYRAQDAASATRDGAFELNDLPAGEYRVLVRDNPSTDTSGRYPYDTTWFEGTSFEDAAPVSVTAGEATHVVIRLARTVPAEAATISGRALVAGVGAEGAIVTAIAVDPVQTARPPAVDERATVAADGTFEIRGLRPGAYVLRFDDARSWHVRLAPRFADDSATRDGAAVLSLLPGQTSRVDLSFTERLDFSGMAPVRGRVTGSDTGKPLAGVKVLATPRVAHYAADDVVETRTAADGTFELGIWNSWEYTISVTAETAYASRAIVVNPVSDAVVWTSVALSRIPVATTPALPGTVRVGLGAKATVSGWTPGLAFTYQWRRNGASIAGATKSTYTPTAADRGQKLTVTVTGSRIGYASISRTSAARTVGYGVLSFATPTVTGTRKVGATLRATVTLVSGGTYAYQWYSNGYVIPGATKSSFRLTWREAHDAISVRVTVRKAGYVTASKTSPRTARISW